MKGFTRYLKSRRAIGVFAVVAGYIMMVDTNLHQRARMLSDHDDMLRGLVTEDLGGGDCNIGNPTEDANPASEGATRTVLASYPGSGKRFTWTIIKALTNNEVADDWDFSGKLKQNPLSVKTSWPHREGVWSWGTQMDQVMVLIRNPRWAIPSYHNMRFELDYAEDWDASYLRIPDTYKERPAVALWEEWRDRNFDLEIVRWEGFHEFWMQGGFHKGLDRTHDRCLYSKINCNPKAVVDFDRFYQMLPTAEYSKITDVLESSANVEIIASQARVCVLDGVFRRNDLHQGGRPADEIQPPQYRFTIAQFDKIMNRTITLRDMFSEAPLSSDSVNQDLVVILNSYILDNQAEYDIEADTWLQEFVSTYLGYTNCNTETGVDLKICQFITKRQMHSVFTDSNYPDDFPFWQYFTERSILAEFFYTNFPVGSTWLSNMDHCSWYGVKCVDDRVTELVVTSENLTGLYPKLSKLEKLETLNLSLNRMTGSIDTNVCTRSINNDINIIGDADNCPNEFDPTQGDYDPVTNTTSGLYLPGCCNEVVV